MAGMGFHKEPVRFPVLVLGFIVVIPVMHLIRRLNKTPPLSPKAKHLLPYAILAAFLIVAAINAYGNWSLGLPQF